MNDFVTPHLRSVLKTYQDSATKSLQGPGSTLVVSTVMKKEIPSPELEPPQPPLQPPEIPQPVLSTPDTGRSILYETILEGKPIGCFLLGGEMRLCFPQVLNNVLMDFGLDQINRIFDELRIFCSQCSPEQLNQFKAAKILPEDVNTSGLITRTNAERLCSALLHHGERLRMAPNALSFRVIHRCFGKCIGICTPDLYSFKDPAFIRCTECNGMFSPQRFVCHVHQQQENSTLHWGFDSNNWRAYLQVAEDEESREKYASYLDDIRDREQQHDSMISLSMQRDVNHLKRKASDVEESIPRAPCKKEPLDIPLKKAKIIEEKYRFDQYPMDYRLDQYQLQLLAQYRSSPYHSFRPWAQLPLAAPSSTSTTGVSSKHLPHLPYSALPYLSQEPPVLQNPERVVRQSECERYEQSYQPNVALAPRIGSKTSLSSAANIKIDTIQSSQQPANGERDYENGDRDRPLAMNVKIKEERPQTPSDESQSPESCTALSTQANPPPISPEGQSASSNEITSSTSPVPETKLNDSTHNHSPKQIHTPIDGNTHHIKQIIQRSHSKASLTTTDLSSPHVTSDIDRHHHSPLLHLRNHHHNQQLNGGACDGRPYHYYHSYNRNKLNGLNSEFELSTDTDDDSLVGEADSSNHMSPLDNVNETLKDAEQKTRDKVLNIIKMLLHENLQISIKNAKLVQELQRKDEEMADLIRENRLLHSTNTGYMPNSSNGTASKHSHSMDNDDVKMIVADEMTSIHRNNDKLPIEKDSDSMPILPKSNDAVTIHVVDSNKLKLEKVDHVKTETATTITVTKNMTGAIPATVIEVGNPKMNDTIETKSNQPSITNGNGSTTTITTSTKFVKSETEVIRMPLKKSVRRTPTEDTTTAATVVIMQPHKLRDEARDKSCDKLDKISRTYDTAPTSPIHQKHNSLVTAKATD